MGAVDGLGVGTPGLHFRKTMHLSDICHGPHEYLPWGDSVRGHRIDACWLQVEDGRYLPFEASNIRLLKRWHEAGDHPRLVNSASLPDLRRTSFDKIGNDIVAGAPFGSPLSSKPGKKKW